MLSPSESAIAIGSVFPSTVKMLKTAEIILFSPAFTVTYFDKLGVIMNYQAEIITFTFIRPIPPNLLTFLIIANSLNLTGLSSTCKLPRRHFSLAHI